MPLAMPLPDHISQASGRNKKQRNAKAGFGGGYEQRVALGTNSKYDTWTIVFENLDEDERDDVVTALDSVGSVDYLTWTAHGDTEEKKWRVTDEGYSEQWTSGIHSTISFTIEQYF